MNLCQGEQQQDGDNNVDGILRKNTLRPSIATVLFESLWAQQFNVVWSASHILSKQHYLQQ